ncbi:hypothetical protein ACFWRT_33080 [Streptomyces cyaneofuscatus]|uniref:hypothetical protein n=1 Tax=Streptomyces cyaneofuscatus TaxID=66883 RepID=UPI00365CC9CC
MHVVVPLPAAGALVTDPYEASTAEEMASFAAGLTIPEPGLGPINRWYREGETTVL